jgi:hypothetical protein
VVGRIAVVLVALLLGAAAPARAWCEASCLAPVADPSGSQSHCPTSDPTPAGTSISASAMDECPVVESARPAAAREDLRAANAAALLPLIAFTASVSHLISIPHRPTGVFHRHTPLRI